MSAPLTRRQFLGSAAVATCALAGVVRGHDRAKTKPPAGPGPTLDLHVHLFGVGDSGSGCRLSARIRDSTLLRHLIAKIRGRAKTLDEGYVQTLVEQAQGSGLGKGLVLAHDAVYDASGKPDWQNTHVYVPNDYLLQVVRRRPQWMVPCMSVNPDRADAIGELERCAGEGVRAVKIHPPIQGVDVADKRHTRFFRRCAELKVVVLVHTGHEHSAPVFDIRLASPLKLALALDQGCTVVACHCGSGWPLKDRPDMLPDFLGMVRKYPSLWGDTSILGSAPRVFDFTRLLADPVARDRLLHGSDFPFPCAPIAFAPVIGLKEAVRVQGLRNLLEQDLALKEALGVGQAGARRAHRLIGGESES